MKAASVQCTLSTHKDTVNKQRIILRLNIEVSRVQWQKRQLKEEA